MPAGVVPVFLSLSALCCFWGVRYVIKYRRATQEWERVPGTIIRMDLLKGQLCTPTIEFTTSDGFTKQVRCKFHLSRLAYNTGQQVAILYDPYDTDHVMMAGNPSIGSAVLFFVAAAVFIVIACCAA